MPKQRQPKCTLVQLEDPFERSLRAKQLSSHTIISYLMSLRLFCRYLVEQQRSEVIRTLDATLIESYLAQLLETQKASTVQHRYRGLKAFFTWCVTEGLLLRSPMGQVAPPQHEEAARRVLSDDEVRAVLQTCVQPSFHHLRDVAIIRLLLDSGLKVGELVTLSLADVDLNQHVMMVCGKGRTVRPYPFEAITAQALDAYLRQRAHHKYAHLPELWLSQQGEMKLHTVQAMLACRGKQAGIEKMHALALRYTFLDRMRRSGMTEGDLMPLTVHAATAVFQHAATSQYAE